MILTHLARLNLVLMQCLMALSEPACIPTVANTNNILFSAVERKVRS